MPLIERIVDLHADMKAWRQDIHTHPELAFHEHRTSDLVAKALEAFGIEVHRGLAGTGVVGTLRSGRGRRAIGLRADMDALPIHGIMHACGHDGHTAMLLGAARYLAETRHFDGVVHFIFQPAEENECGGQKMVEDGLFERFPVEAVYGMHNWPGLAVGSFGVCVGPIMAADDKFEIAITGRGAHAAMPHLGDDPIVAAAALVGAIQTIVSRTIDPQDGAVVSVTQMQGGNTWNIVPEQVVLRGTCRYLRPGLGAVLRDAIRRVADGVTATYGVRSEISYYKPIPPAVNAGGPTQRATRAAATVVGDEHVQRDVVPSMGCEDFAFMLAARPGCYLWIGNGPIVDGVGLHSSRYAFNDDILPIGASYWAALVEGILV
ncbi:MAG TPA: M20 aminoacylase family protein [Gemmatimonadaceae bacterium]|jgi:hippurate hydrolase|nr:M20 aminoacylase family protein [Gemmatimonadaceae bacterium]